MIAGLKTFCTLSRNLTAVHHQARFFTQLYLVKVFSLETSLIWTVIARSKLVQLVPDWHDFYGVKGEYKRVQT